MCGLCGAFGGGSHWSDRPGGSAGVADRRRRAAEANAILALYGLRLAEWGGRFTLASRTGRTEIVANFGELWPAAERLTGAPCDPLDLRVLQALEGATPP